MEPATGSEHAVNETEKPSILMVDDKPENLMALGAALREFDIKLVKASSGNEALELMLDNDFALLLLDVNMPGMDGFETAELMRRSERTKHIPIIFVSAVSKEQRHMFKGYEHGAVDFLVKPLDLDILHSKVSVFLDLYIQKKLLQETNRDMEKLAEERAKQLVHADRLASIGQLAAGVAHEINNPVGFIYSNLGSLGKYIARIKEFIEGYDSALTALRKNGNEAIEELSGEIEQMKKKFKIDYIMDDFLNIIAESTEGTERIKKIVSELKSFSRVDQSEGFKPASVNEGLESTLNVVWNELKYKCTVEKDLGDLPLTSCNLGQLNQVFMNLLVNASHAIEEKGTIKIITHFIKKGTGPEAGYIEISISDTGCGIPEDMQNKVFEPFFTTKEVGKGTGLGLSIAYDIIKKHGGEIKVQSKVGQGTTFTIHLPVTA